MEGWIKIDRKLLNWEWYETPGMVSLWVHLLLVASHEDRRWKGVEIKRGQVVTTLSELSEKLGFSRQNLRTMLSKLQNTGEINQQTNNRYTLITICKYEDYQQPLEEKEEKSQPTTNQRLTNDQPTTNQRTESFPHTPFKEAQEILPPKERIKKVPQTDSLDEIKDLVLKAKFLEWLDYRKKRKKPVNDPIKSYHLLMGPTRANGDSKLAIECLDYSMGNSWDGIFIDKQNHNTNDHSTRIHITSPGDAEPDYGESTI